MSTLNLNYQEMIVLKSVSHYGEETLKDISDLLSIPIQRALQLVNQLKNKHLVMIKNIAGEVVVSLTNKGKHIT